MRQFYVLRSGFWEPFTYCLGCGRMLANTPDGLTAAEHYFCLNCAELIWNNRRPPDVTAFTNY